mmetsp:Transcript_34903/g.79981  ORF Transcript_34903/g.79981 Transcript_34903/m.79981 type:complete len:115 (-) Transcript_34903:23-367(-)
MTPTVNTVTQHNSATVDVLLCEKAAVALLSNTNRKAATLEAVNLDSSSCFIGTAWWVGCARFGSTDPALSSLCASLPLPLDATTFLLVFGVFCFFTMAQGCDYGGLHGVYRSSS